MQSRFAALAVFVIWLTACGEPTGADTLTFNGRIDEKSVAQFAELLRSPSGQAAQWVEITSAGGDAPAGFKMGRLIHERGLSVRVKGYCNSACAQSVFLAGRVKEVEPGSLVLFHDTMGMMQRLHAAAGDQDGAKVFAPFAADEAAFLNEIGVRADITELALASIKPLCLVRNERVPPDDPNRYGLMSQYASFALSRTLMEDVAGGAVQGYWPASAEELKRTLSGLPFNDRFTVAWTDGPVPRKDVPILSVCPPELVSSIRHPS